MPVVNNVFRSFAQVHSDKVAWVDRNSCSYICLLSNLDPRQGISVSSDGMRFSHASGGLLWRSLGPQSILLVASRRLASTIRFAVWV